MLIKEFTYIRNIVNINGIENVIDITLNKNIQAVQFHQNRPMLEETKKGNIEVEISKYKNVIEAWEKVEKLKNKPLTKKQKDTQAKENHKQNIFNDLDDIDKKSIRALRENNLKRLQELESQAIKLREELI